MSDVIDSFKDLSDLVKEQMDVRQRTFLIEAVFKVLREERADVLGELVDSAMAKWESFKGAAKSKPKRVAQAKTPFSLSMLKAKVVESAKSTREAIAERGAVAVIKDATASVGGVVSAVNRVRVEVSAILDERRDGQAVDRASQVASLAKVLGFAALILIDKAQQSESELKDDASQMIDRLSTVLLAEEALIAIVVLQLGASIVKRAEVHLPKGEPAQLICAKVLELYDIFSSVGAEYLMSLKIKGLDGRSKVEILDTQGRLLLDFKLASDADLFALRAARRMAGVDDTTAILDKKA